MEKTILGKPLVQLEPLVGEWSARVVHPALKDAFGGSYIFDWWGGQTLMVLRIFMDHPDFPDSLNIISATSANGRLEQHYYDTRGVHRALDMTFVNGVWTLSRRGGPGDFDQRFIGVMSPDRLTLSGAWERTEPDHSQMKHDFEITLTRI